MNLCFPIFITCVRTQQRRLSNRQALIEDLMLSQWECRRQRIISKCQIDSASDQFTESSIHFRKKHQPQRISPKKRENATRGARQLFGKNVIVEPAPSAHTHINRGNASFSWRSLGLNVTGREYDRRKTKVGSLFLTSSQIPAAEGGNLYQLSMHEITFITI